MSQEEEIVGGVAEKDPADLCEYCKDYPCSCFRDDPDF